LYYPAVVLIRGFFFSTLVKFFLFGVVVQTAQTPSFLKMQVCLQKLNLLTALLLLVAKSCSPGPLVYIYNKSCEIIIRSFHFILEDGFFGGCFSQRDCTETQNTLSRKKASPFIIGSLPCKGEIICSDIVSIRYHISSAGVIVN
jgi:hypothetical protein